MAVFSKTIGNGFAISAVVGTKEIMDAAQKTWISSTFWTERIGPTAACATLKEMERVKSWEIITELVNQTRRDGKHLRINMVLRFSTKASLLLLFISLIVQII